MELEQINALLEDPLKLRTKIMEEKPAIDITMVRLFDIENHEVLSLKDRPMKKVNRTLPEKDEFGAYKVEVINEDVERIPFPFQKRIVNAAAAFLCGNPIELAANPTNETEKSLIAAIQTICDDNKLDYDNKFLAKCMMAETEVAELWYVDEDDDANKVMKKQILRSEQGTALYPVFDKYGDMIAFGRAYDVKDDDGQTHRHFDVYTAEKTYFYETKFGLWAESKPAEPNQFKKIPIIYYSQEQVEWADVQRAIKRYETLKSNHAETNNYSGSPILKFRGEVRGVGDKHEQGKAVQLDGPEADAEYLTLDGAPESIKMEMEGLKADIMDFTSTPDISPTALKGLFGSAPSGYAIKLLFQDAHLKASDHESNFGKSVQRRINFLKAATCQMRTELKAAIKMRIKPRFEYYLPKNTEELIDWIVKVKNEGLMSQETAVMQNPLLEDPKAEWDKIQKEKAEAEAKALAAAKQNQGQPGNQQDKAGDQGGLAAAQ